tara:strand:+ start:60 stop:311 length:252 start_codon:yes stop_codon:yes gene_type:complete
MTKKDFITVAQALQKIPSSSDRWLTTNLIADSLAAAYSNFHIDKFIEYAMQWNMNVYEGTPARVGLTEKLQNNRNRNNSKIEV